MIGEPDRRIVGPVEALRVADAEEVDWTLGNWVVVGDRTVRIDAKELAREAFGIL